MQRSQSSFVSRNIGFLAGLSALLILGACGSDAFEATESSAPAAAAQVATTEPVPLPATAAPAATPEATPSPVPTEIPSSDDDTTEPADPPPPPTDPPDLEDEPTEVTEPADPPPPMPTGPPDDPDESEVSGPVPGPGGEDGTVTSPPIDAVDDPNPDSGWTRLTPRNDLSGEQSATPEAVLAGPDGTTVLVRFWGGAEPCFAARVEVTEVGDRIEVQLITGLPPGAEAISCIALAVAYEFEVPLSRPVDGRQIVAVNFAPAPGTPDDGSPDNDGPDGAVFETAQYVGLAIADAEELARIEGRSFRIARLDDEVFGLTLDFDPSRVNVEVEGGIVVAAEGG